MFDSLLSSTFLQVLGNALIASLWQAFVLWILYKLIVRSIPSLSPSANHNLGVVFIFLSFISFLSTILINGFSTPVTRDIKYFYTIDTSGYFMSNTIANAYSSLSVAYLVLQSFISVKLFCSLKNTLSFYEKKSHPADERIVKFIEKTSALLHIQRNVTAWVSDHITTPATIGFLKPVILLPAVCVTHLSVEQLEAIIVHELSHIRRNDFLLNIILLIIENILFFNPFVYLLIKDIRSQRENCCDDLVLKNNYEPLLYASALLTIGKYNLKNEQFSLNAVSGKHQLLKRIQRITKERRLPDQEKFSRNILVYGIAVFFFFCLFSFIHAKDFRNKEMAPSTASTVNQTPSLFQDNRILLQSQNPKKGLGIKQESEKKNIKPKKKNTSEIPLTTELQDLESAEHSVDVAEIPEKIKKDPKILLGSNNYQTELGKLIPSVVQGRLLQDIKGQQLLTNIENSMNQADFKKYFQIYELGGRRFQSFLNNFKMAEGVQINVDSIASKQRTEHFYQRLSEYNKMQKMYEGIKVQGYRSRKEASEPPKVLKIANI